MFDELRQRIKDRALSWTRPRRPETVPTYLNRHRVYVVPTAFGYFLAALILVMCIGALNYNNNPALFLALILGASALASLILTHLQISGLRIDALSSEPVPAGTPLTLRLGLSRQDGRSRRGLRIQHGDEHVFHSLETDSDEASLLIPTEQRGWLALGRIGFSSIQPLGLARGQAWIWPEHAFLVYPTPELRGPDLPPDLGGAGKSRAHPLGDDLYQLRSYRPGDPIHSVSWKHSARQEMLLVREYEQTHGTEITLAWQHTAQLGYERRISRLARWVDEAERSGQRYRLVLPDRSVIGPDRGMAHRHSCLKALALLPHEAR